MSGQRVIYTNSYAAHPKDSHTAEIVRDADEQLLLLFDDATTYWAYPDEIEVIP